MKLFRNYRSVWFSSILVGMAMLVILSNTASAQSTEFSYQGHLQVASAPATGNFDFQFALFDTTGALVGGTVTRNNVAVANGIFAVKLDFGSAFPGADRLLEIRVRQAGGSTFTTLAPRQSVNSTPYAVQSTNSGNANTVGGIAPTGFIQNSSSQQAPANFNINGTGTAAHMTVTGNADIGGSLGIGTTTPAARLEILDPSNKGLRVGTGALGGTVASFGGRGAFQIDAEGILGGRLNVLESGNIGVGVTAPAEKLSVNGKVQSTSGGFKFPDGTVQTTAANSIFTKRRAATDPPNDIMGGGGTGGVSSIMIMNAPPGTYLISMTVEFRNLVNNVGQNNNRRVTCQLSHDDTYSLDLPGVSRMTTTFNWLSATNLIDPEISVFCSHSGDFTGNQVQAAATRIVAVRIEGNVVTVP